MEFFNDGEIIEIKKRLQNHYYCILNAQHQENIGHWISQYNDDFKRLQERFHILDDRLIWKYTDEQYDGHLYSESASLDILDLLPKYKGKIMRVEKKEHIVFGRLIDGLRWIYTKTLGNVYNENLLAMNVYYHLLVLIRKYFPKYYMLSPDYIDRIFVEHWNKPLEKPILKCNHKFTLNKDQSIRKVLAEYTEAKITKALPDIINAFNMEYLRAPCFDELRMVLADQMKRSKDQAFKAYYKVGKMSVYKWLAAAGIEPKEELNRKTKDLELKECITELIIKN